MANDVPDHVRALVADDQEAVLNTYRAILRGGRDPEDSAAAVAALETMLFGSYTPTARAVSPAGWSFDLTLCRQAEEAVQAVRDANEEGRPYAVAFLDVYMPPGRDGLWAAQQIRELDPLIGIVIATGYSDGRPQDLARHIPPADKLFYVQKPFHPQELLQFVVALSARWHAEKRLRQAHAELEAKVEERTAELARANVALKQEITERRRAEEETRASLRDKEILLREIHHRVKNNLQVIHSLLRLQSRQIEDERYREMFRDSQNRIRSMALIHETLYQSKDLANVSFREYVERLMSHLSASYGANRGRIRLGVDADGLMLGIDVAIPCGLIVNELVSNSLKHAFPEDRCGEIRVSLQVTGGSQITLTVSDDGIGLPEDMDFRDSGSLGLHLVTMLVEDQLHGQIELNRAKGTEFRISFVMPTLGSDQ